jgi:hypothetical protein
VSGPRDPDREKRAGSRAPRPRGKRGRSAERQRYVAERRGPVDPAHLSAAVAQRRSQLAKFAPADDPNIWMPIGPTVVVDGQAGGKPRVSGRANDLWISSEGTRAYVATANGGVWFSPDLGESWKPIGGWAAGAVPAHLTGPSSVVVCGCMYVNFKADAGTDEVLVGTGEMIPGPSGAPFSRNSGVGILRKIGPAAQAEFAQTWDIEGTNLAGKGIYRLAVDPTDATTFVAATSGGLWTRTGAPAATWNKVAAAPFNAAGGDTLICTDVVWTAAGGGLPARLWVAVRDDKGAATGLYLSTNGLAGPFNPVPGIAAPNTRMTLAAAPSNPGVVYVLAEGNQMWRLDGAAPTVTPIARVPPNLLGGQDDYNQGLGVHPTRPERIVIAGATELADGDWSASLYLANVTGPTAGSYQFGFTATAAGANPVPDDSFIGHGVHPDVHMSRFFVVNGVTELWVGCDGGLFRSTQGDADNRLVKNTFVPRNLGIASLQIGYVATHPLVDGYILAGTQDCGTIERVGDTVWRLKYSGDGGGVAFHPLAPQRHIYQNTNAAWYDDGGPASAFTWPVLRTTGSSTPPNPPATPTGATNAEQTEDSAAEFYSGCDAVIVPAAGATPAFPRVAFGTNRVWVSGDWGTTWRTLPLLTDPMALAGQNTNTDATVLVGGVPSARGTVIACRWASPTRLLVLCRRAVFQYDIVADAAAPGGFRATKNELTRQATHKKEDPQAAATVASPGQVLPALGAWSDVASHLPNQGPHGAFYVATTGDPATSAMDTLWWFDGTDRWFATGLRTDAVHGSTAPAYAVVVDNVNTNVVYVGTGVGVWKGTFHSGAPWDWEVLSNGLPEAAVQDLTIVTANGVRILRAAVQSRGVWDLDLAAAGAARTFVRVHAYDNRRTAVVSLTDPLRAAPNTSLSWHASPDVRVRPVQGSKPPNPRNLPWNGNSPDAYGLWVFQTAIRTRPQGRTCKANGQWTPMFDAILRRLTGSNRVTQAIWNANVGSGASFPNAYATPWDSTSPSEADLLELIQDLTPPVASTASIGVRPRIVNVDVLVHHRHLTPAIANTVKVTLLRRDVSGTNSAQWATIAGGFTTQLQAFLINGGATPVLPDGWTFADMDAGHVVRNPAGDVDARLPRAATFTVDLHSLAAGNRVLLLAVVNSGADPVQLPNVNLQTLVLGTRFVGLRSLEIV